MSQPELTGYFGRYVQRFKPTIGNHPELLELANDLETWFSQWAEDVSAHPPRFADNINPQVRQTIISSLREDVNRLQTMVSRGFNIHKRIHRPERPSLTPEQRQAAMISRLEQSYDPPGGMRQLGPRHDNDFEDIAEIRISPTHGELLSPVSPYLPPLLAEAQHHLPPNSIERHLDIQFRLLREEMVYVSYVNWLISSVIDSYFAVLPLDLFSL